MHFFLYLLTLSYSYFEWCFICFCFNDYYVGACMLGTRLGFSARVVSPPPFLVFLCITALVVLELSL